MLGAGLRPWRSVGFPQLHRKQIWQWEGPLPGVAVSHFFHHLLSSLQVCRLTLWLLYRVTAEPALGPEGGPEPG